MTEAGRDAAQEAPNIFAAMDALATRAASFAERRQRALQDRQAAGAEAVSPRAAATAAARSIKQVKHFPHEGCLDCTKMSNVASKMLCCS